MEDIISYAILFSFGLTALYLYQKHRTKQRNLPLSIQHYPDLLIAVIIQKQYGKTQKFMLKITAKAPIEIDKISMELIDNKRNFEIIDVPTNKIIRPLPITLNTGEEHFFYFEPDSFQAFLKSHEKPFSTFRFVAENNNGKKFKSHNLAFDKNWVIYKPDSGTYN